MAVYRQVLEAGITVVCRQQAEGWLVLFHMKHIEYFLYQLVRLQTPMKPVDHFHLIFLVLNESTLS